jgi:TolA-binding protein
VRKINKHSYNAYLLAIGFFLIASFSSAQQSLVHENGNSNFRNALDLYGKEKFLPAQKYFEKTIIEITDIHSEVRIDAEYYSALCAVELFHSNASTLLKQFIEEHPESSHSVEAYFNLAKFQFRKKRYEDVLDYLANIEVLDLEEVQHAEYYFKRGYSHFELDELDEAAKYFYEIKDSDNPYVAAARYYYAHISYKKKKYSVASENFDKIKSDPQFGSLVPYYMTQIYYLQQKYEQLITYAPAVLDSAPPKRENEIRKLIGNAYYELKEYDKSISYLETYLKRNTGTSEDFYQLGFANYKTKNYSEAIKNLQKSVAENDTLAQNAYYYIGESNIKLDNKRFAKDAFRAAYRLDVDPEIKEDALFNYAKTAYELSSHPYDNAILAFEEYINGYPNSTKLSDAYEYLLGVYYTTKNYKEALRSIDRIKNQDIELLEAKQRIAHYRAIELFLEAKYGEAIELFKISRQNNYDRKLYASSLYWMSESYYLVKDYSNANGSFSDFLASGGSISLPFYHKAYYGLAYTGFEEKKYKSAIFWFREYVENADTTHVGLINDALLRIGDSYFIQKDYRNAITYYDKAAKLKISNQDYALLQSAISSGVLGNYQEKAAKLTSISNLTLKSVYQDDALFELGKTYLVLNKELDALAYYNRLVDEYPNSNFLAEAHLKIGLINFNQENDDIAMASFDKVVKDYPSSKHANDALDKIRKIFIDKADAEGFENYINGVPFANISKSKLDSTSYVIAENNYLDGKCEKATRDFTNYLNRYSEGIFSLNAHYYRADCESRNGFDQEAVIDFQYVINQASNKFTEKSLVQLGRLYWSLGQLDSAKKTYKRLLVSAQSQKNLNLAERALMDLYFEEGDFNEASNYAQNIIKSNTLDKELFLQANMIMAKSLYEKEDYESSLSYLDSLSTYNNLYGAESKYLVARIYYLQGLYMKSDTVIYTIVDQVPSVPYWIAKGFILLADNFISKGDYYNARITFQSVIDNAENDELISIATEKLAILKEVEELDETNETAPIEIIMNEENVKNESIFEIEDLEIK